MFIVAQVTDRWRKSRESRIRDGFGQSATGRRNAGARQRTPALDTGGVWIPTCCLESPSHRLRTRMPTAGEHLRVGVPVPTFPLCSCVRSTKTMPTFSFMAIADTVHVSSPI